MGGDGIEPPTSYLYLPRPRIAAQGIRASNAPTSLNESDSYQPHPGTPARRIPPFIGMSKTRMHAFHSHAYRSSRCGMRRCPRRVRRARADHNSDLRVAYFGAPLITSQQAKAVPLGITRRELFKRLHGRSGNALGSHSYFRTWKICIVYPVKGTGVKYTDGFVSADEWEFCFGFDGRLKRRFFTGAHHI